MSWILDHSIGDSSANARPHQLHTFHSAIPPFQTRSGHPSTTDVCCVSSVPVSTARWGHMSPEYAPSLWMSGGGWVSSSKTLACSNSSFSPPLPLSSSPPLLLTLSLSSSSDLVGVMLAMGNKKHCQIWEAKGPIVKPTPSSTREEREAFIRAKYIAKEFLCDLLPCNKKAAEV